MGERERFLTLPVFPLSPLKCGKVVKSVFSGTLCGPFANRSAKTLYRTR